MQTSEARIVPPQKPYGPREFVFGVLKWIAILLFVLLVVISFRATEFNLYTLVKGAPKAQRILSDLAHPDFSWHAYDENGAVKLDPNTGKPRPGTLRVLLAAMWQTLQMGLISTIISVLLSFPLAFLGAGNLMKSSAAGRAVYAVMRTLFNVLRAFPEIILAVIFVFIVGTGPFAGVLALALHSIGTLGKLFSEAIEQADSAPVEAMRATGASSLLTVWYGIVPQVLPQFVAFALYRWDINIRMSIIIGIVGAGGIGFLLEQYIRLFQYDKASTCFLIILAVVTVLDFGSAFLRRKMG